MLDIKLFRHNFEEVKEKLKSRSADLNDFDSFQELDERRRQLVQQIDQLRQKRNDVSREIAMEKKQKRNVEAKILEMRQVGEKIKQLEQEIREIEEKLHHILISVPNVPHESVPIGQSEEENICSSLPRSSGASGACGQPDAA